ncbi:hypothetical protein [Winogradskyella haliclonae]|uniref:Uncharacterized protein n=1 Tax=Winogradskyella haliclonae TaxID=2048558 RepID=A0ABQ2C3K8_9FLAO|nr:hypothetical protein [Winogradskyella haliclonae]GGI58293.1 hypothetical protein GCM10011444_26020 [Winogradskyella haliclonae]
MNTKFLKLFTFFLLASIVVMSCDDKDSIERTGKPSLTIDNSTVTVTEGETATFNFTVEYPVSTKIDIRIDVLDENENPIPTAVAIGDPNSGNGYSPIDLDDIFVPYPTWFDSGWFNFGYLGGSGYVATFDPFTENFSIDINTLVEDIANPTKIIKLRLSATSEMAASIDEIITINIENLISDNLISRFEWDGSYSADPCSDIDFDLELYYEGAFTDFSYGSCPEEITISGSDPDGTYVLDASLWETFIPEDLDIPVTLSFIKSGVFVESVDLSSLFPSNNGGLNQGNGSAITSYTIVKSGNNYTITDSSNNIVAQGRFASNKISLDEKRILKANME